DDKGRDARKRAYCLKIQPATGSFARNLIYSTKPLPADHKVCQIDRPFFRAPLILTLNIAAKQEETLIFSKLFFSTNKR
ncbi:MAG: hypothetical protein E6033_18790, partial [Klebsiella pneumoniae]|nr:hypothetical protein [Klebsiella pneumoniae]